MQNYEKAKEHYISGNIESALSILKEIDANSLCNFEASSIHHYRGRCHAILGEFEKSIDELKNAVKTNPNEVRIHIDLGMTYLAYSNKIKRMREDCLKAALNCFEEAIMAEPMSAEAWYYRGVIFEKIRQVDESIKCYSKALGIDNWTINYESSKIFARISSTKI